MSMWKALSKRGNYGEIHRLNLVYRLTHVYEYIYRCPTSNFFDPDTISCLKIIFLPHKVRPFVSLAVSGLKKLL